MQNSYRYKGQCGYINIYAASIEEALDQAKRSTVSGLSCQENLEVWDEDAGQYVAADA
jgi:hypothetical protein